MTALKMMLCGELQKSVEYREKEVKTYEELRSVVMKWAINQKIQNERTQHDPMDCSHVPWHSPTEWGSQDDWKNAAEVAWNSTPPESPNESPTDVDYANSKGKGKGDNYSQGGKGQGEPQNSAQYHMMMAMKAMKGSSKGTQYPGNQGPGIKGGGKGKGKADERECYNCGAKGHIARNCPHPKNPRNSRVPIREAASEEGEELIWGAAAVEMVPEENSKKGLNQNPRLRLTLDSGETKSGSILISGIKNAKTAENIKALLNSGGIKAGAFMMNQGSNHEGVLMIDETEDIDAAEKSNSKLVGPGKVQGGLLKDEPWRKKIQGGYRLKFVLDSGAVKSIIPKDAIPGMKLDNSKGGSFRVASGAVIPNLGSTKLKGTGTLGGSPIQVGTQVAEVTKPLASCDEMVNGGMMVIMHRSGDIAKRLDADSERRIRDIVKAAGGSEIILERARGSFTFEMDVKSDDEGWKTQPLKRSARPGSRAMDVSETQIEKSYYDALWEEEYSEMQCMPCYSGFHRH